MASILDNETIEITCPHCSRKLKERVGKLKANQKLTCRHCGGGIDVDSTQLTAVGKKLDKSLTDLQRKISRTFK